MARKLGCKHCYVEQFKPNETERGLRSWKWSPLIGFLSVLHSWGSALTHHPHVHMIVPGGGISRDGSKWISCRPRYLLPVPVLSALFRRLFLEKLVAAHRAGELQFFGNHAPLTDRRAFAAFLAPLHNSKWVVYCKDPFGRSQAGAALSGALHPPRRHLQQAFDCMR